MIWLHWDRQTDTVTPLTTDEYIADVARYESIDYRRVAMDAWDDVVVYTTFLGLDHSFGRADGYRCFETVYTLGGEFQDLQIHYDNSKDALNGHRGLVEALKKGWSVE